MTESEERFIERLRYIDRRVRLAKRRHKAIPWWRFRARREARRWIDAWQQAVWIA